MRTQTRERRQDECTSLQSTSLGEAALENTPRVLPLGARRGEARRRSLRRRAHYINILIVFYDNASFQSHDAQTLLLM